MAIDEKEVDTVWGRLRETKRMTREAVEKTEAKLLEEMNTMKEKTNQDMKSMKQDVVNSIKQDIAKLVAILEKEQGKK